MNNCNPKSTLNETVRQWADESSGSPSLLISQDDNTIHLSHYAGMGNTEVEPIESLKPEYRQLILNLFNEGSLVVSERRAFTLYPGSPFYKRLVMKS